MSDESVSLSTRSQSYVPPPEKKIDNAPTDKTSTSIPAPTNGIQIEKVVLDIVLWPPKSMIRKSVFNPNACATQYYNVVEYLDQEPCAMSTLKLLQTFPS